MTELFPKHIHNKSSNRSVPKTLNKQDNSLFTFCKILIILSDTLSLTLSEFVSSYVLCNPIRLAPIYPLPKPTIYRIILNDGHCTQPHTSNYTS